MISDTVHLPVMETKTTVSEESKKDDTAIPIRVPTSTAHTAPTATAEVAQPAEVPDPDEDDLDDLDGELCKVPPGRKPCKN